MADEVEEKGAHMVELNEESHPTPTPETATAMVAAGTGTMPECTISLASETWMVIALRAVRDALPALAEDGIHPHQRERLATACAQHLDFAIWQAVMIHDLLSEAHN
ncbi:hypothetical protein GCM10011504_57480 [Siccirubricoccus deserti]|uniref:DUF3077 domain-containing protein n=1 Tax=Siccirubricoccus deserti TaxID=2013562 RepID=A0A9X0R3W3_9PROT|nr:hypothetical protein [Siccirubricoccus deserti]MBC4019250.1 hypothetical protein [Siccirubricoccus deserti]GGC72442.1 hypothetical protein GCM10011504_57480 [Siccirubricoccus deserti]